MTIHLQVWHLTNAAKRLDRLKSDVEAHLHPVQKCQLDAAHREVLLVRDALERERNEGLIEIPPNTALVETYK